MPVCVPRAAQEPRLQTLGWKEAIVEVLGRNDGPMHYTDIADQIAAQELRSDLGATPANTVAAVIGVSLRKDGADSLLLD